VVNLNINISINSRIQVKLAKQIPCGHRVTIKNIMKEGDPSIEILNYTMKESKNIVGREAKIKQ
jgi:hypothetical protein